MNVTEQAKRAKSAALKLQGYSTDDKNKMLLTIAESISLCRKYILEENEKDLADYPDKTSALFDRLTLNDKRIDAMVEGVKEVAALPDPVGEVTDEWVRPSGISIKKVRSPIGVIAIIYEARPNVTVDAAALCVKSGNAVILRGSRQALNCNRAIYKVMYESLKKAGFDADVLQFIDDPSHDGAKELLSLDEYVDVVIPRGGEGLKHFVLENSSIPVLASAGGNCHIFVAESADFNMALNVIENAKCSKPSVCNAVEHILVDNKIAKSFIPKLYARMRACGVTVLGDEISRSVEKEILPASDNDYDTEFLSLTLTVKTVDGVYEAIDEINTHGTRHSEAIITSDKSEADVFTTLVDAAATYVNASTRFTDGFEFGFGAEMGISTGKLHARGPIGLEQLTSERYVVTGDGAIRK